MTDQTAIPLDEYEAAARNAARIGSGIDPNAVLELANEVRLLRAQLDAEKTAHLFTLRQRNNRSQRLTELRDLALAEDIDALLAAAKDTLAASIDDHTACAEPSTEDLAAADNPTQLRWGLDDVLWVDDDSVIVLMSGPDREAYWLELDPERAAVLRRNLAGPDGDEEPEVSTQPCGHDDYHDTHEWADRPGTWCPGHSLTATPAPAAAGSAGGER